MPIGALLSLPQLYADEAGDNYDQVAVRGTTTFEKQGDLYETGPVDLGDKQIGAYAVTLGSERCIVGFNFDVPAYKRLWLRLKIRWKRSYQ